MGRSARHVLRTLLVSVLADGGVTNGTPVLASAAGTAYRFSQPSGAGNYIAIEHGGVEDRHLVSEGVVRADFLAPDGDLEGCDTGREGGRCRVSRPGIVGRW